MKWMLTLLWRCVIVPSLAGEERGHFGRFLLASYPQNVELTWLARSRAQYIIALMILYKSHHLKKSPPWRQL